jgi:RNA polymerase sigma-70 factor (ECF subfamily)
MTTQHFGRLGSATKTRLAMSTSCANTIWRPTRAFGDQPFGRSTKYAFQRWCAMKTQGTNTSPIQPGSAIPSNRVAKRLQSVIERVLQRVLGSSDPEYEDVLQDALERVLATLEGDRFRGECPLSVWAALIARKVAADTLRERYRERRVFVQSETVECPAEFSSAEGGPERLAQARERLRGFTSALSQLRAGSAEIVYLHSVLGYELAEIAPMVGISVAAAQSRLVRGRREIAHRMKPQVARPMPGE